MELCYRVCRLSPQKVSLSHRIVKGNEAQWRHLFASASASSRFSSQPKSEKTRENMFKNRNTHPIQSIFFSSFRMEPQLEFRKLNPILAQQQWQRVVQNIHKKLPCPTPHLPSVTKISSPMRLVPGSFNRNRELIAAIRAASARFPSKLKQTISIQSFHAKEPSSIPRSVNISAPDLRRITRISTRT